MNWMMFWLTVPPLIAAIAALIMVRVSYQWGYSCGQLDAQARHSLASLERTRANRAQSAGMCP